MTRFAQSRFSVGVGSDAYRKNFDAVFGKEAAAPACAGYTAGVARGPCEKPAQVVCDTCGTAYCDDHGCACP